MTTARRERCPQFNMVEDEVAVQLLSERHKEQLAKEV